MSIKHEVRHALPSIFDWTDNLPGFYAWPTGQLGRRGMRVEEFVEDGTYVVRAEMPGLDPEKDITVEVNQGVLAIHAERREEHRENGRSEFAYGTFTRRLTLPQAADEAKMSARYAAGILEVSVPLTKTQPEARTIPIEIAH